MAIVIKVEAGTIVIGNADEAAQARRTMADSQVVDVRGELPRDEDPDPNRAAGNRALLHRLADAISRALARYGAVFVHCEQGQCRSPTAVAMYLVRELNLSEPNALATLRIAYEGSGRAFNDRRAQAWLNYRN